MTLGQKLKMLLKENGMTQEDLAERLEVSRQAVGKWVNDKGIPEVEACHVFEWVANTVWLALVIWSGMSMHIDNIVIKNTEHTPKGSNIKRYRWIYTALPFTAIAVVVGMITNAWSPYAPVIILFCCLLITTCKLLVESKGKTEN